MYDGALGRFFNVDPLATDYYFQSPYVYAANNPIRFIDWMGMEPGEPPWGCWLIQGMERAGLSSKQTSQILQATGRAGLSMAKDLAISLSPLDIWQDVKDTWDSVKKRDRTGVTFGLLLIVGLDFLKDGKKAIDGVLDAVGDVKSATTTIKKVHGNSKLSKKSQHGYEIFNKKTGEVLEYGISGQKRSANQLSTGGSPRINQKLRTKYGNDPNVAGRVTNGNLGNRKQALE